MKFNKILKVVAVAAMTCTALVACNKDVDGTLTPEEADDVVSVKQTVYVSFSQDLRDLADISIAGTGLDGEEIVLDGAKYSDELTEEQSFPIENLTLPCTVSAGYSTLPKSKPNVTIGQKFTLGRTLKVVVELLDKKNNVVAFASADYPIETVVTAAADTDWNALLTQSLHAVVELSRNEDGSLELKK